MDFVRTQIQRLLPVMVIAGLFVLGMDRAAQQRLQQEQRLAPFTRILPDYQQASKALVAPRFTRYWRVSDPVIR